jgi:hypothetical protein
MQTDQLSSVRQSTVPRDAILQILGGGHNISLVGTANAGKTRLLRALTRISSGLAPHLPTFVYLDCRRLSRAGPDRCFQAMAKGLERASADSSHGTTLSLSVMALKTGGYARLNATLAQCSLAGVSVVFLLDHLDRIEESGHLDAAFFGLLRSLGSRPTVSFVCATRMPLCDLKQLGSRYSSSFGNIFLTYYCGEQPIARSATDGGRGQVGRGRHRTGPTVTEGPAPSKAATTRRTAAAPEKNLGKPGAAALAARARGCDSALSRAGGASVLPTHVGVNHHRVSLL